MSDYEKLGRPKQKQTFTKNGKRISKLSTEMSEMRENFKKKMRELRYEKRRLERLEQTIFDKSERRPLPEDRPAPSPFYQRNADYVPMPNHQDYISQVQLRSHCRCPVNVLVAALRSLNFIDCDGHPLPDVGNNCVKGRDGKNRWHKSVLTLVKSRVELLQSDDVILEI